ncbi:MAG TPA: tetratricopeptide repeat protein [Verrucomicrobiae bacterium]|jgi:hypothetical protein
MPNFFFLGRELTKVLCLCVLICSASLLARAAETVPTPPVPSVVKNPEPEPVPDAQQVLRSYLQVQEQLHSTLQAIDQARQASETAARQNAETLSTRLKFIEQALTTQREQVEAIKSSNSFTITVTSILGGIGLIGLLVTSVFLFRSMNRLAESTALSPPQLSLGPASHFGETLMLNGPELASGRLLGALERLEKRILDMENKALLPNRPATFANGNPPIVLADSEGNGQLVGDGERLSLLLAKGQALLHMDKVEEAITTFDEVLTADARNGEALLKKGAALERMKKLEEAIHCYDQAIATNQSMTLAYLYKGGVYNQMERFSEALECYEQALRTQQRAAV